MASRTRLSAALQDRDHLAETNKVDRQRLCAELRKLQRLIIVSGISTAKLAQNQQLLIEQKHVVSANCQLAVDLHQRLHIPTHRRQRFAEPIPNVGAFVVNRRGKTECRFEASNGFLWLIAEEQIRRRLAQMGFNKCGLVGQRFVECF